MKLAPPPPPRTVVPKLSELKQRLWPAGGGTVSFSSSLTGRRGCWHHLAVFLPCSSRPAPSSSMVSPLRGFSHLGPATVRKYQMQHFGKSQFVHCKPGAVLRSEVSCRGTTSARPRAGAILAVPAAFLTWRCPSEWWPQSARAVTLAVWTRHGAAVKCSWCMVRRSGTLTLCHRPASVTSLRPIREAVCQLRRRVSTVQRDTSPACICVTFVTVRCYLYSRLLIAIINLLLCLIYKVNFTMGIRI